MADISIRNAAEKRKLKKCEVYFNVWGLPIVNNRFTIGACLMFSIETRIIRN